jgi:S-formylglutathione hydrolase
MESYVTQDLAGALAAHFPWRRASLGIFGHSMGGHGALTLALRHPGMYRSVSAFAPIAAPMQAPWGVKAFGGYLGPDRARWAGHDATELVKAGARVPPLLVDQGLADKFLAEQLSIDAFEAACRAAGQPLTLRRHAGYDHGYYFIASFVEDHLRFHADALNRA